MREICEMLADKRASVGTKSIFISGGHKPRLA
jgi:hypothetical protein